MTKNHWKRTLGHPVVIATAVAVLGVLAMLIVDHGPWTRPKVQTAEVASHKTTGDAARAVGLDSAWLPQRMLTNAAHIAASPAPTKT